MEKAHHLLTESSSEDRGAFCVSRIASNTRSPRVHCSISSHGEQS
jgi:hypothetical protein